MIRSRNLGKIVVPVRTPAPPFTSGTDPVSGNVGNNPLKAEYSTPPGLSDPWSIRYECLETEVLGRSSSTLVTQGFDHEQKSFVALKKSIAATTAIEDFARIVRFSQQLPTHPNLLQIRDFHPATRTFVTELMAGNVQQYFGDQPLPPGVLADLLAQGLSALEVIHGLGRWHGAVRPVNLFWDASLGLRLSDARGFEPGSNSLTPLDFAHVSPEELEPALFGPAGERSDLYSLAASLLHTVLGRGFEHIGSPGRPTLKSCAVDWRSWHVSPNTRFPSVRDLCQELDSKTATLLDRMLHKRPEERPDSAADALAELSHSPSKRGSKEKRVPNLVMPPTKDKEPVVQPVSSVPLGRAVTVVAGPGSRVHGTQPKVAKNTTAQLLDSAWMRRARLLSQRRDFQIGLGGVLVLAMLVLPNLFPRHTPPSTLVVHTQVGAQVSVFDAKERLVAHRVATANTDAPRTLSNEAEVRDASPPHPLADGMGVVRIELASGTYSLKATCDGYEKAETETAIDSATESPILDLTLKPLEPVQPRARPKESVVVKIQVFPPHASVMLERASDDGKLGDAPVPRCSKIIATSPVAAKEWQYELINREKYRVHVAADRFASQEMTFLADRGMPLDVRLEPIRTVLLITKPESAIPYLNGVPMTRETGSLFWSHNIASDVKDFSIVVSDGESQTIPNSIQVEENWSWPHTLESVELEVKPATGIQFGSIPEGGQIYVDKRFVGNAPMQLPLEVGEYEVEVRLPGYLSWRGPLRVDKGTKWFEAKLRPDACGNGSCAPSYFLPRPFASLP